MKIALSKNEYYRIMNSLKNTRNDLVAEIEGDGNTEWSFSIKSDPVNELFLLDTLIEKMDEYGRVL